MALRTPSPLARALGRRLTLHCGVVIAFVVVDMLLVAACAVALRQNVRLRGEVAGVLSLLAPAKGTVAPPLAGTDWKGAPQTITYERDRHPTLVYTFSKGCGSCQENWRAMRSLQTLAPRSVRIVYVDTSGDIFTSKYLNESGIGQSVLLVNLASPAVAVVYEARAVPQLLLVDHDGRVQWSHVGELAHSDVSKALSLIQHN